MGKKGKISLFVFILLLALIVLVHVQARRVMLALIETQAADNVETKIGTIQLRPLKQTILLKDVSVSINDKDSPGFRKASVKRVHLEMGSLWAFFFGGTLVIDKMECDGGELIMARSSVREPDATAPESFDLRVVFEGLRKNAIRFRIQEMSFQDFNLTLLNDSTNSPTLVKHLQFRARDLYLSADSILKRMPYIECGLPSQQIIFPNGTTTIKFDSLFFSTSDNSIQLNEAELVMNDGESGSQYRINSDKVRVAYFDFESLFTKGMTIVDSIFLGSSKLEAKVNVQQRSKTVNKNAPSNNTLPYLLVRNLMVRQLAAKVQLKQQEIENSFTINHSSVTIQHLEHSPDSSQRLTSTNFDILISDYETLLNNKNTSITFDTVRLHRHGLALLNFNISKAAQARPILQTSVFELREVDWYTLLFFKKLVAKEAIAVNPIVNTTFMPPAGEGGSSQELVVLESLKELLDVNLFSLRNASAILRFDEGRTAATLKGINASILVNRMIESKTFNDVLDATPEFSFRNFALKSSDTEGRIENFTLQQGKFYFGNVDFADGDKLNLKLKELNLDHIIYDGSRNNLAVSGLTWRSAVLRIKSNAGNGTSTNKNLPEISLSMLLGGNTEVYYSSQDLIANAYFNKVQTNALLLGDSITIGGLYIVGSNLKVKKDSTSFSAKLFSFADNGSIVENIQWNQNGIDTLHTTIERISFTTDFNRLAKQQFSFPRVDVTDWRAAYNRRDSSHTTLIKVKTNLLAKDVRYEEKKFTLGSLNQTFDSVYYLDEKRIKKEVEVAQNTPVNERWKIRDDVDSIFDTGNSVGVLLPISAKGARPSFGTPAESPVSMLSTKVEGGQNSMVISVSNIQAFSKDSALQVTGQVDSIRFRGIYFQHNDIHTRIDQGAVKGLNVHSGWVRQPMEMLRANYPTAAIVNLKLHVETDKNVFKFDRLDYDPLRAVGSIKGLEFRPVKDKQAFLDESFFQTNYMHAKIESLSFEKWDPERYLNDSTIHLGVIRVNGPVLEIGRDKTHPFYSSRIKLLPTNSFQKLGVKFKVDSLQIQNGHITYTEKSKVTSKEGLIHFTNVQGLVRNIKNVEMKTMDTLFLEASARFLDSANVNLRVRESYHDTLAGFLMTTQVSPFHTSILNPVLVPLVSVEFQSGFVDTLQMHAVGREHIALGRMKFLYRDLKVNFLDQNDTSRHSIKNYILKFAANNLVIKTNNKKRIGDVMELRDRHRAVFQYWVKMILSGVTTSVGAKSNRSQMKKYSRELNTRKLPPIEVPLSGF